MLTLIWLWLPCCDNICKPPLCESNGLPGQISSSCLGWQRCPGFHSWSAAHFSDEEKHNSCNALPCPTEGTVFCSASVSRKVLGSIYFFIDQTLLYCMGQSKVSTRRLWRSVQASIFYILNRSQFSFIFVKCFSSGRSAVELHNCEKCLKCDFSDLAIADSLAVYISKSRNRLKHVQWHTS